MELILKRYKHTSRYTLSRLYEPGAADIVNLDIVEPPVAGFSQQPLSSLNPGIYKLFLKALPREVSMVPRFQKVAGKPFFYIDACLEAFALDAAKFTEQGRYAFMSYFSAGRLQGENLMPDKPAYDRLITRLCIAMKQKDKVKVKVI